MSHSHAVKQMKGLSIIASANSFLDVLGIQLSMLSFSLFFILILCNLLFILLIMFSYFLPVYILKESQCIISTYAFISTLLN